jgi:hypothetical protein
MELAGNSDFALTAVVRALVLPLFSAPATGIGRRAGAVSKRGACEPALALIALW